MLYSRLFFFMLLVAVEIQLKLSERKFKLVPELCYIITSNSFFKSLQNAIVSRQKDY